MFDFSRISTDKLEWSIMQDFGMCSNINCRDCPLREYDNGCNVNSDTVKKLFKEELEKREKDMNKMPELKAGMIVKYKNDDCMGLYINDKWVMSLDNNTWWGEAYGDKIIESIYSFGSDYVSRTFKDCFKNSTLIWSRKSDKDIKIEEIQVKMDQLKKELDELKG